MTALLPHRRKAFQPAGGGGSDLLTGLVEWWDLDEASGNALSAGGSGGNDLTDNNTVGADATGAPDGGGSRVFTAANSEYFSAAAGNVLNNDDAVTIAGWVKWNNTASNKSIFGHNAPNGYSQLQVTSAEWIYYWFDAALAGFYNDSANTGSWRCFAVTSTGAGGSDELFVENVSRDTDTKGFEKGSAVFYLGAGYTGAFPLDGELTSVAIWDRVLDSDELTEFYNSGTNLRYADL